MPLSSTSASDKHMSPCTLSSAAAVLLELVGSPTTVLAPASSPVYEHADQTSRLKISAAI